MATTQIIAHRGAWKRTDLPQNSIAALQKSKELNCDGCELDVHLTADGVVVVNHDHDFYGLSIEESTYTTLKAIKHLNDETIPTLENFLAHASLPLFLEIKASRISMRRSLELAERVLTIVDKSTFTGTIHYISFLEEVLIKVLSLNPAATVSLLNGKLAPAQIKSNGWQGFDYHVDILRKNPRWISEARELELLSNVWTVNDAENMRYFLDSGIDFISTDEPEALIELRG